MNNGATSNTIVEKPPLVVEIIGPAGAGKTTLVRALSRRDKTIQPGIPLPKTRQIPFFISNTFSMLPTYLRHYRHSRWFNWRETRSMVYLKAGLHVFRQEALNKDVVTVLDHGPIYRLATLREFGPELTTSQLYARWWANLFSQWAATLDMIIWLDAPNVILLDRIRCRDHWHVIKEKCEREAYDFLTRYRTAMEQLIVRSVTDHQVALLRFDTSQKSAEQIVDKVLATFDAVRRL